MSIKKKIMYGVGSAWVNKIVVIISNLLFIPVLFQYIDKETLGIWFLLSNSQQFLNLLGLGIAPTLSKKVSLAKGDKQLVSHDGLEESHSQEIADLLVTGKTILRYLSIILFGLTLLLGYFIIHQIRPEQLSFETIFITWCFICLSYSFSVWFNYFKSFVFAIGYVGFQNNVTTFLIIFKILSSIILVKNGFGIVGLGFCLAVFSILERVIFIYFLRWQQPEFSIILRNFEKRGNWDKKIARSFYRPSFNLWLRHLGQFSLLKTDQYFIAFTLGIDKIPIYQATYQLVANLRLLAISLDKNAAPFLSQIWKSKNLEKFHSLVIKKNQLILLFMGCSISFILTSGKNLFSLWLGNENFIGNTILITFCLTFLVESNLHCLVSSARATGQEKYGWISLITGALNMILTWILIRMLGLWGVSLATLISILLTDNTYSFIKSLSRIKIGLKMYFVKIIRPFIIFTFLNLSIAQLAIWSFNNFASYFSENVFNILVMCISATISFIFFVLILWKQDHLQFLKSRKNA